MSAVCCLRSKMGRHWISTNPDGWMPSSEWGVGARRSMLCWAMLPMRSCQTLPRTKAETCPGKSQMRSATAKSPASGTQRNREACRHCQESRTRCKLCNSWRGHRLGHCRSQRRSLLGTGVDFKQTRRFCRCGRSAVDHLLPQLGKHLFSDRGGRLPPQCVEHHGPMPIPVRRTLWTLVCHTIRIVQ
jgi:hypothetical protein